jgi:hypothetical protein
MSIEKGIFVGNNLASIALMASFYFKNLRFEYTWLNFQ